MSGPVPFPADLARSLHRGVIRREALFNMSLDVLDLDDSIIDHESNGDRQCHQ